MMRRSPQLTILCLLSTLSPQRRSVLAVTAQCLGGPDWTRHGASCYRWFNATQPWYPAEAACRSHGGHLASIQSDAENRLIGRLSGCRGAWIGRYAVDLHRLTDRDAYEWTDGISGDASVARTTVYSRHNFSAVGDPHMGAVLAAGLYWFNAHYHEPHPYVCETPVVQDSEVTTGESCPARLIRHGSGCYWLSDFAASFVEAGLHCEREFGSRLTSIHSSDELSFIGTLDLETDACQMSSLWIGLIKETPCRRPAVKAGPGGPQESSCYKWTDLSGQHDGPLPSWLPGEPQLDDLTINCAVLTGEGLKSERCHERRRFVCKRTLGSVAMATQPTEVPLEAAPPEERIKATP